MEPRQCTDTAAVASPGGVDCDLAHASTEDLVSVAPHVASASRDDDAAANDKVSAMHDDVPRVAQSTAYEAPRSNSEDGG